MSAETAKMVTTAGVRRAFLDFFSQRGHALLPSSPVLPIGDPSVPFVPAGMHQFRHVLLGQAPAPAPKVANSQRCIRVGGRHCDLASVGHDGSHLSFFEMLGSWTFGGSSYWKREVCSDALQFLTGPLHVDPSRLHITYFGGDPNLELEADQECYEAWRSLGIPEDRIRPNPTADNLWEMGATGPCGPCTEIHIDGTEIWNLVFIQQERSVDGSLSPLGIRSVDTGMGLERVSALLANRSSVFDTDTFLPLFETITKSTKVPSYGGKFENSSSGERDAAYRVVVDHARTIAVAVADGVIPARHYKLRRMIRRTLLTAERHFKLKKANKSAALLEELAIRTVEMLSEAHPSLVEGIPAIRHLIHYEASLFSKLRKEEPPEWFEVVAEEPRLAVLAEGGISPYHLMHGWRSVCILASNGFRTLKGYEAYNLYDRHGLTLEVLDDLAKFAGMTGVDSEGFLAEKSRRKDISRIQRAVGNEIDLDVNESKLPTDLPPTDTTSVYRYSKISEGRYDFPSVRAEILALLQNGQLVNKADPKLGKVGAVLSATNLYRARGGQHADYGRIESRNGAVLNVVAPIDADDVVVHWGQLEGAPLQIGDEVEVHIDAKRRMSLMRNHTAVHLLNKCLRQHVTVATQRRAPVAETQLGIDLDTYGEDVTTEDIETVEKEVRKLIRSSLPVKQRNVTMWNWHSFGPVILIPDAAYPSRNLSLVEIGQDGKVSRELCGGTHVFSTADISDIIITKVDLKKGPKLTAVTGEAAKLAEIAAGKLLDKAYLLADEVRSVIAESSTSHIQILEIYSRCQAVLEAQQETQLSYLIKVKANQVLKNVMTEIQAKAKEAVKSEVAEAAKDRFAAVFVKSASILDSVQLNKAARPLRDKALLLIALLKNGQIRARSSVPNDMISVDFNAKLWLDPVAKALKGSIVTPRGFDAESVCLLENAKVLPTAETVQVLVDNAQRFAEELLQKRAACA